LVYLFTESAPAAFVGTLIILFCGVTAAGQGGFFNLVTGSDIHYSQSLIFLRRTLPATGFPALFLFFIFVWKFVSAATNQNKILWGLLSVGCFSFNVFSYFYFWTTAIAWFFGLVILWAIFRFEDLRKNKICLLSLAGGFLLPLIPYFILLQNRSTDVDSALVLSFTHQPDLWRVPELVSYLAIGIFVFAKSKDWITLREPKYIFLLSFTLVAPIVFNQQILTGRILQPFHYEFFCANYIAVFSLVAIIFCLLRSKFTDEDFHKWLLVAALMAAIVGYCDTLSGVEGVRTMNLWRDDLVPVTQRIKEISAKESSKSPSAVLSFDFPNDLWANSIDIPVLTSKPVLWSLHMSMFPDVNKEENVDRLYKFLYYQNFDEKKLKDALYVKNNHLIYGFFGGEKTHHIYSGKLVPIKPEEIENVIAQYRDFRQNFNYENARTPKISLLVVNKNNDNNFSTVDRWFERDDGENVGEYILYRVKLRNP